VTIIVDISSSVTITIIIVTLEDRGGAAQQVVKVASKLGTIRADATERPT